MRAQLIQYVNLLFAGAADCDDIRQEILQNTLDRYDDLIAEGKTPEAAYRLAISGIGDISEILSAPQTPAESPAPPQETDTPHRRALRAIAVALYILCPIPVILIGDIMGLCGTLVIVAAATALMILGAKKEAPKRTIAEKKSSPRQELRKSICGAIWALGLVLYFIVSFSTNAWYITWIIILIICAVQELAKAIIDLMEVTDHEN